MKPWLSSIASRTLVGGVLIALAAAAGGLSAWVEEQRPPGVRAQQLAYLPKGDYLRLAALGYRDVVADVFWLRAVQHFGDRKPFESGWRWAYHATDVVTDLSPHFVMAYLATGTILGVWSGLVEESIAILKKGMIHNPDAWQLPFTIGYDYFYELCDVGSAAPYLQRAAELPGAPAYLPHLAARMAVEGGDPDAALEFLERLDERVRDPRLHAALVVRMKEVIAERNIRRLESLVAQYRQTYDRLPGQLGDLVTRGLVDRLPDEPLGGRYVLSPDGTVTATGLQDRMKVHRKSPCNRSVGQP